MPLAGPDTRHPLLDLQLQVNCPPIEPIATIPSFLLLFLCFVREKQTWGPELQWATSQKWQ